MCLYSRSYPAQLHLPLPHSLLHIKLHYKFFYFHRILLEKNILFSTYHIVKDFFTCFVINSWSEKRQLKGYFVILIIFLCRDCSESPDNANSHNQGGESKRTWTCKMRCTKMNNGDFCRKFRSSKRTSKLD